MDLSWKDVGDVLGKVAPIAGNILTGNIVGAAVNVGSLIASACGVEATPDAVHQALTSDPAALERIRKMEMDNQQALAALAMQAAANELAADTARQAETNATMRTEVQSEDAYVRRWRPTFGYAVALTWTATMVSVSWAIVTQPAQAPSIIAALVNTSPIWGIALGVLGVAVVKRSQDKALANQGGA